MISRKTSMQALLNIVQHGNEGRIMDGIIETFFKAVDCVSFYGGLVLCGFAAYHILLPAMSNIVFHCP